MSELPPEKKLRMTELKMTDSDVEPTALSADELNRFSRQNAALGKQPSLIDLDVTTSGLPLLGACEN